MAVLETTTGNFATMINTDYAVVDCYGSFCSACVMLDPVYAGLANDMAVIRFLQVNLDESPEIADRFEVDAMPTLLYFRKGRLVNRTVGSMDRKALKEHLAVLLYGKDE